MKTKHTWMEKCLRRQADVVGSVQCNMAVLASSRVPSLLSCNPDSFPQQATVQNFRGRAVAGSRRPFLRLSKNAAASSYWNRSPVLEQCSTASLTCRAFSGAPRPMNTVDVDVEAPQDVAQELVAFLEKDLVHLFDEQGIDKSMYAQNVVFKDPLTRYETLDWYLFNISMLRVLFRPLFELHTVRQTGPNEITTRWTMTLNFVLLPWRPKLVFTGVSIMNFDVETRKFVSHVDLWDSVQNNEYLSLEAVMDMIRQMRYYKTPDLETPRYQVLRRAAAYEVRKYDPILVVEADSEGLAGNKGFNDIAGYIFGKNVGGEKFKMTTPVFTKTRNEETSGPSRIQIVLPRAADLSRLPAPNSANVEVRPVDGGFLAASKFSGKPFPERVSQLERDLRAALVRDGLVPQEGSMLARYNDPDSTPDFIQRNEVLIGLQDFKLE